MTKAEQRKADKLAIEANEKRFRLAIEGLQINIMDLSSVHKLGLSLMANGMDDIKLREELATFVDAQRRNNERKFNQAMTYICGAGPDTEVPEEFDLEAEMEEGVVISDKSYLGGYKAMCSGKLIAEATDMETILARVGSWMDDQGFYPNIFRVNDHGNVSLIDTGGNSHGSWV